VIKDVPIAGVLVVVWALVIKDVPDRPGFGGRLAACDRRRTPKTNGLAPRYAPDHIPALLKNADDLG
jgi:hypothetical protein